MPTSGTTYLMKGRDIRSGTPKEITLKRRRYCRVIKTSTKSNFRRNKRCFGKNTP